VSYSFGLEEDLEEYFRKCILLYIVYWGVFAKMFFTTPDTTDDSTWHLLTIVTQLETSWHHLTSLDSMWHCWNLIWLHLTQLDTPWHPLKPLDTNRHHSTSLDSTWPHLTSHLTPLDTTWHHLTPLDTTWHHLTPLDTTWLHFVTPLYTGFVQKCKKGPSERWKFLLLE
jgi:hypothetical protein